MTDGVANEKKTVVFDIETYPNYFLVMFRSVTNGKTMAFEMHEDQALDVDGLMRVLRNVRLVSFNGNHYDMPIVSLACKHANNTELKQASDAIIEKNLKPWEFENEFDVRIPKWDHIDLIEVAPGFASLKIYGGRLHAKKMQDLPIEPHELISPEQREALKLYCGNDLQTTVDLYNHLLPQLQLRETMTEEYGRDLRSKSDAQIAETVIKDQVTKMLGRKIERPTIRPGTMFTYKKPPMVAFESANLRDVLGMVERATFKVTDTGKVEMPDELASAAIKVGGGVYRMGIGGLHSSEQSTMHVADANTVLLDRDVASYYPSLILLNRWTPRHLGQPFLDVYRGIVERRLAAKREGNKVAADALKITINGSFGKLGSKWSALYSPDLLIQVTVTGQLCLLMLIEALELSDIPVVSANTDGIVIKCPVHLRDRMLGIVADWEMWTGLETEETRYRALCSRDVNNYIALKDGGGYKAKGAYAAPGLQKNPTNVICVEAVAAYLEHGVPILRTIEQCTDVRKFVTIRQVKGGAVKGDQFLGKAVRWYYAVAEKGAIHYKVNGNQVARSEGAKPLMELPDHLPDDIDYAWYVDEAYRQLNDIGFKHPKVDE